MFKVVVFPDVMLFPSLNDGFAKIETPSSILEIVKEPIIDKSSIFTADNITWDSESKVDTIKLASKEMSPPAASIEADPTDWPIDKNEKSKEPPSDTNKEVDISG